METIVCKLRDYKMIKLIIFELIVSMNFTDQHNQYIKKLKELRISEGITKKTDEQCSYKKPSKSSRCNRVKCLNGLVRLWKTRSLIYFCTVLEGLEKNL